MADNNSTFNQVREQAEDLKERAESTLHELPSSAEMQERAQSRAVDAMDHAEKTPDTIYLAAALGSIGLSLGLFLFKKRGPSLFVGVWPVTILALSMLLKNRRPSRELAATNSGSTVMMQGELIAE